MGKKKVPVTDFMDRESANSAARIHDNLADTDLRRRVSEEASRAMAEIEDVFTCRHPDELIDWVKSAGMDMETFSRRLRELVPGQFMTIQGVIYVKTPTKEFQRADAYLNRLEKSVLENFRQNKHYESLYLASRKINEELRNRTFWQQIKAAFASLRKNHE